MHFLISEKSKSPPRDVFTRPSFVQLPRDITVYEGQDATFSLKIEGKPEPTVKWYVIVVSLMLLQRFFNPLKLVDKTKHKTNKNAYYMDNVH